MAEMKILGQAAPAANQWVSAYMVGVGKMGSVTGIAVCNRSTGQSSHYSIRISVNGEADSPKQYIANLVTLGARGHEVVFPVLVMGLWTNSSIMVLSDDGNCSFNILGSERTAA